MAKSAEVLVRVIDADIARLEGELADLRETRARVLRYAKNKNGTAAPMPKRAYHRKQQDKSETDSAPHARNGKPGIGQQVIRFVQVNPGLPKKAAIQALVGLHLTDRQNPRKVYQTRVGQLLETKELREEGDDDKLFVNE